METILKDTSKSEQKLALKSLTDISSISDLLRAKKRKSVQIKIKDSQDFITIPIDALLFLVAIIRNMADGKTISLIPSDSEVSTQQAAEMLNISRPHLIKILNQKKIPHKKVGSHRRLLVKDITSYIADQKKLRDEQLDFLTKQAQDLNMGYE